MGRWLSRPLIAAAVLFAVGWVLVLASGYSGDATGGSELAWRVGGIMVYTAVATLLVTMALALIALACAAVRSRCRRA